jgi:hypothetical protein
MLSGILFTLGLLAAIGGFGFAVLSVFAAGMASGHTGEASGAGVASFIGLLGLGAIVASFQI